ncbi:MAG: IS200/IS605 family transposase [Bacteroidota bacterium]
MANSYTQIHIQVVFAVKNRQCLIHNSWKIELYKYITGILQNQGHKMIQINGMPDHIHLLFGMRPTDSLSNLIKRVKQSSSKWINDNRLVLGKFSWQSGYGAFSYSKNQIARVANYVSNQEEHHRTKSFREEYIEFLKEFDVDYDERYLFEEI